MQQLGFSDIPVSDRLVRIREGIAAGCTRAELITDVEVAISVLESD
jgi:hypothetical protein